MSSKAGSRGSPRHSKGQQSVTRLGAPSVTRLGGSPQHPDQFASGGLDSMAMLGDALGSDKQASKRRNQRPTVAAAPKGKVNLQQHPIRNARANDCVHHPEQWCCR